MTRPIVAALCGLMASAAIAHAADVNDYPTAARSSGVGWALGIGRFGSIAGPLVGGLLVGLKVPPRQFFAFAAVPMVAGLIASIFVAKLCQRRLGGMQLDELSEPDSPNTAPGNLRD